jgi:hypothetical protein
MTDRDHDRSDNTGTGAKALDRDADGPVPSQSGSSGGGVAREVGMRDEEKAAFEDAGEGRDPSVTGVHKSDMPHGGAAPRLPHREGGAARSAHVLPRRTK